MNGDDKDGDDKNGDDENGDDTDELKPDQPGEQGAPPVLDCSTNSYSRGAPTTHYYQLVPVSDLVPELFSRDFSVAAGSDAEEVYFLGGRLLPTHTLTVLGLGRMEYV